MKSINFSKNTGIIAIIAGLTCIFGILIWNRFFPSLQSSVISLPPEVVVQIDSLQGERNNLLQEKKTLMETLSETQKNIESVEENLTYNSELLHSMEEEFQKINTEIVLNESRKGKDLTNEEYEIATASLLQKKQDVMNKKNQTQTLQENVSKQRNALSQRISQSDLRIRQIDIEVRTLDTQIARIISQSE